MRTWSHQPPRRIHDEQRNGPAWEGRSGHCERPGGRRRWPGSSAGTREKQSLQQMPLSECERSKLYLLGNGRREYAENAQVNEGGERRGKNRNRVRSPACLSTPSYLLYLLAPPEVKLPSRPITGPLVFASAVHPALRICSLVCLSARQRVAYGASRLSGRVPNPRPGTSVIATITRQSCLAHDSTGFDAFIALTT